MSKEIKGIVLAGGTGSRLYPITKCISKQLLPIYDKPLIYYPISVLMLSGIKDILIISNPDDLPIYKRLLGDGSSLGVSFTYTTQKSPDGIAQAFIIAEDFIKDSRVALILGDNIFYGQGFSNILKETALEEDGATIFSYRVNNPKQFGVVDFDKNLKVLSIEEKPKEPRSNFAITGLYFCDNDVVDIAKTIKPSQRGELEISEVIKVYMQRDKLSVKPLGRGFTWFDSGTPESFMKASQFIEMIEKRQGFKIACLEEIAYYMKYITKQDLIDVANSMGKNNYSNYLLEIAGHEMMHNVLWKDEYFI